jgi:ketosteroid isomerase-like protein
MQTRQQNEELVHRYFDLIRQLRTGVDGAPEKLLELWDPEGTFEFAGSPPVTGMFIGINAIKVLYSNRFAANGMPLKLEGTRRNRRPGRHAPSGRNDALKREGEDAQGGIEDALGTVDTDVSRMRTLDDERVVAGWTTVVGTRDRRGYQISGSHSFTFKDGRISKLRIVVSPKPEANEQFDASALSIDDIGRLSLAAWAVV